MSSCEHVIIAIHGIGSQSRNSTVRSVATRFARSVALASGDSSPLSPQPLGYFHTDVREAVKVVPLDKFRGDAGILAGIGFCEVFWADIPEEVAKEKRTLEETKAWARTVVARANAVFTKGWKQLSETERNARRQPDFGQAGEVLEEVIDTVEVIENLCFLAEKAGVVKINIGDVLEDYLGDVQLVTEFTLYRRDIVGRFHRAMEQIHREHPSAKLHIVAHSEGTVVSFLGLLHAMSCERIFPGNDSGGPLLTPVEQPPAWLEQVHGYMTFGSPIDKHLLLWPELFENLNLTRARGIFAARAEQHRLKNPTAEPDRGIEWRNYYDVGDPVGFELDTARAWLDRQPFNPFHFKQDENEKGPDGKPGCQHDIGFARYMMPGAAHTGYWEDPAVFEHFVRDVVRPSKEHPVDRPRSRWTVQLFSPMIPYAISFLILFAGVWIFYRTVAQYITPPSDPVQDYVRYMTLGLPPSEGTSILGFARGSLMVTLLVAGTTLLSRFPRLVRERRWFGWGIVAFAAGAAAYVFGMSDGSANAIGTIFGRKQDVLTPAICTIAVALFVGIVGLLAVPKTGWWKKKKKATASGPRKGHAPNRRSRLLLKGMRPLILSGAVVIAVLVGFQILEQKRHPSPLNGEQRESARQTFAGTNVLAQLSTNSPIWQAAEKRLQETENLIKPNPPLWPVVLAGLAFLYLWWLSGLLFDLAFVWQRYVRQAASLGPFRECVRSKSHTASG